MAIKDKLDNYFQDFRDNFYYENPVYVPGYIDRPWIKWLGVILFITALGIGIYLVSSTDHRNKTSESPKTNGAGKEVTKKPIAISPNEQPDSLKRENSSPLYPIVRVIDGDTVDVNIDGNISRIRLIGVNTPESVDPRKTVECFGKEASQFVKSSLEGKSVSLESDSSQSDRDKFGRLLRYIILPDGTNFDKEIITKGFGYEYTYDIPYKYQTEFRQAQAQARSAEVGLWADGACGVKNNY